MTTVVRNKPQILTTRKTTEQPSRRTKYDLWSEILDSCVEKQRTKFWLTSRLRLSYKVVDESLRFLTNGKLIKTTERQSETTKYKTTVKGQEALNVYKLLVEKYFFP
jgi:predicted transcriptional regulator